MAWASCANTWLLDDYCGGSRLLPFNLNTNVAKLFLPVTVAGRPEAGEICLGGADSLRRGRELYRVLRRPGIGNIWKARAPRSETNDVIILGMIAETMPVIHAHSAIKTKGSTLKGRTHNLCGISAWKDGHRPVFPAFYTINLSQRMMGGVRRIFGLSSNGQFSRESNGRGRRPAIDRWLPVLETRAAGPGIHSTQRYVKAQLFRENDISGREARRCIQGYMDFSDDLGHLGDV
ncbi:hypothetical protein C8R45DRAFT_943143 [Mycena sanguinolenta]|nr:hypothetical protein C8R45DRAFT_943143 [Mycena sanguinolenta]